MILISKKSRKQTADINNNLGTKLNFSKKYAQTSESEKYYNAANKTKTTITSYLLNKC